MYIPSSYYEIGSNAVYASEYMPQPADGRCLNFYYHMFGTNVGTLNVYIHHVSFLVFIDFIYTKNCYIILKKIFKLFL